MTVDIRDLILQGVSSRKSLAGVNIMGQWKMARISNPSVTDRMILIYTKGNLLYNDGTARGCDQNTS
jgi:hypothetical protein